MQDATEQLTEFAENLEQANLRAEDLEADICSLTGKLSEAEARITEQQGVLEEARALEKAAEQDKRELVSRLERSKESYRLAVAKAEGLDARVLELQAALGGLQKELDDARLLAAAEAARVHENGTELDVQTRRLQEMQETMQGLEREANALRQQIERMKQDHAARVESLVLEHEAKVKELEGANGDLRVALALATETLQLREGDVAAAHQKTEGSLRKIADQEATMRKLLGDIEAMERAKQSEAHLEGAYNEKVDELKGQLRREGESLRKELEDARADAAVLQGRASALEEQKAVHESDLLAARGELEVVRERLLAALRISESVSETPTARIVAMVADYIGLLEQKLLDEEAKEAERQSRSFSEAGIQVSTATGHSASQTLAVRTLDAASQIERAPHADAGSKCEPPTSRPRPRVTSSAVQATRDPGPPPGRAVEHCELGSQCELLKPHPPGPGPSTAAAATQTVIRATLAGAGGDGAPASRSAGSQCDVPAQRGTVRGLSASTQTAPRVATAGTDATSQCDLLGTPPAGIEAGGPPEAPADRSREIAPVATAPSAVHTGSQCEAGPTPSGIHLGTQCELLHDAGGPEAESPVRPDCADSGTQYEAGPDPVAAVHLGTQCDLNRTTPPRTTSASTQAAIRADVHPRREVAKAITRATSVQVEPAGRQLGVQVDAPRPALADASSQHEPGSPASMNLGTQCEILEDRRPLPGFTAATQTPPAPKKARRDAAVDPAFPADKEPLARSGLASREEWSNVGELHLAFESTFSESVPLDQSELSQSSWAHADSLSSLKTEDEFVEEEDSSLYHMAVSPRKNVDLTTLVKSLMSALSDLSLAAHFDHQVKSFKIVKSILALVKKADVRNGVVSPKMMHRIQVTLKEVLRVCNRLTAEQMRHPYVAAVKCHCYGLLRSSESWGTSPDFEVPPAGGETVPGSAGRGRPDRKETDPELEALKARVYNLEARVLRTQVTVRSAEAERSARHRKRTHAAAHGPAAPVGRPAGPMPVPMRPIRSAVVGEVGKLMAETELVRARADAAHRRSLAACKQLRGPGTFIEEIRSAMAV